MLAARCAIAVVMLSCIAAAAAAQRADVVADRPIIDLGVTFGIRALAPDGWDEFSTQQSFGADFAWRRPEWPAFLSLDLHAGGKTNSEHDPLSGGTVYTNSARHMEAAAGLRWIGYPSSLVVSVGAGMAFVYGAYAKDTIRVTPGGTFPDQNASGAGPWLSAGVRLRFNEWYSAGIGIRATRAHGTLYGRRVDLGGVHTSITFLGVTWPRQPMRRPYAG